MTDTSSIVKTLGAGSGIDMAKLATDLATAQFEARTERLAARSEALEQKISIASTIKNSLSLLSSALGDRLRQGDLAAQPSVLNTGVATASAPLGTSGKGSYTLEVQQLASAQTLTSTAFATSDTVVGGGTLTFDFGVTTAAGFTADAAAPPLTVDIPSGATLSEVAQAINGAGGGVTAYVAQTANGAQLVLKGAEGAQNGFVVSASELAGEAGLSALAWNSASGSDPAQLLQTSADAAFRLDGLPMTSATNATGIVAPGLQLTLTGTNPGAPTRIVFGDPSANITGAMQDIVSALNEVAGQLRDATDPLNGDLARDPGARTLRSVFSQLAGQVIMPNAAATQPRTLADLGLATERDGTFRLDTNALQNALQRDPAAVAAMFTTGINGVYATIDKVSRNASQTGDPGSLAGSIASMRRQASEVSEDTAELAEQQEALRASLTARFAKADTRISASQATLSFLRSQIDAWNVSSK